MYGRNLSSFVLSQEPSNITFVRLESVLYESQIHNADSSIEDNSDARIFPVVNHLGDAFINPRLPVKISYFDFLPPVRARQNHKESQHPIRPRRHLREPVSCCTEFSASAWLWRKGHGTATQGRPLGIARAAGGCRGLLGTNKPMLQSRYHIT
jgi:hypothetical protein